MSLLQNPFDPASEAALVTGAGNGIGRAIAQGLVGEGVRTVFADVSAERVTAAIASSPKSELALPFVGDLGKRPGVELLAKLAACTMLVKKLLQNRRRRLRHWLWGTATAAIRCNVLFIKAPYCK